MFELASQGGLRGGRSREKGTYRVSR